MNIKDLVDAETKRLEDMISAYQQVLERPELEIAEMLFTENRANDYYSPLLAYLTR